MPELPEVETVRRGLVPVLEGATILEARIHDARLTRPFDPSIVANRLTGERVRAVDRRGKYLVVRLESGGVLLVHLRMTGSFRVAAAGLLPPDPHRRAVLSMDNGSDVAYRDVRRFGTWEMFEPGDVELHLARKLGPEPLGRFSIRDLARALRGRRTTVKSALLDQRVIAGLGNIYVDEALWRARIHPRRSAAGLDEPELRRLHRAIRDVLALGIERQGASLRDYSSADGTVGSMQDEFRVYGRSGHSCDRCGTPLERIVVSGRGTAYCPRCQPGDAVPSP